jgi:hypothetical protein
VKAVLDFKKYQPPVEDGTPPIGQAIPVVVT